VGVSPQLLLTAAGGAAPYTFKFIDGSLPPGLTLAATAIFTGTPTTPDSFRFVVQATDANQVTQLTAITVTVAPASGGGSTIVINPTLLNATVGQSFSATLTASGGTAPYTFSLVAGQTITPGLNISTTGVLSGTPTTAGNSAFMLQAADSSTVPATGLSLITVIVAPASGGGGGTPVTYYFAHLTFGGGWQSTLTYINYSLQTVTCTTSFYSASGTPMPVAFGAGVNATRSDALLPGGSFHDQTVSTDGNTSQGWAQATCSGPIQAALLYRSPHRRDRPLERLE
jgi:large repetitive protein